MNRRQAILAALAASIAVADPARATLLVELPAPRNSYREFYWVFDERGVIRPNAPIVWLHTIQDRTGCYRQWSSLSRELELHPTADPKLSDLIGHNVRALSPAEVWDREMRHFRTVKRADPRPTFVGAVTGRLVVVPRLYHHRISIDFGDDLGIREIEYTTTDRLPARRKLPSRVIAIRELEAGHARHFWRDSYEAFNRDISHERRLMLMDIRYRCNPPAVRV